MPTTSLMPLPKQQYLSNLGTPLVGGKVYTYAAGTNNPKATYTDAAGTVAQANPIVLNVRGEPASAIFWSGAYKVEVRDALGNVVYTVDNFNTDPYGMGNLFTAVGSSLIGFIQAGAGAAARWVQDKLRETVSVTDYGAVGDGVTDDTPAFQKALAYCVGARKSLYVPTPPNEYKITATLYPKGVKIYGDGEMVSKIRMTAAATLFKGTANVRNGVTEYELFDFVLRDITILGPGKAVAGAKGIEGDTYRCNFERYTIGEFYTGIETMGAVVKIGKGRVYGCTEGIAVRPLKNCLPATTTTIEAHIDTCDVGLWVDHVYSAAPVWPQQSGWGGAATVQLKNMVIEDCPVGYKINRASGILFLNSYAEQCTTAGYQIDATVAPTFINFGEYGNGPNSIAYNSQSEQDSGYNEIGLWGMTASRLYIGGANAKGGAGDPFQNSKTGVIPGRDFRAYISGGAAFLQDAAATTKDNLCMGTTAVPKQYAWTIDTTNTVLTLNSYLNTGAFGKNGFAFNQTTGNWCFGALTPNTAVKVAFNGAIASLFDNTHDLGVFNFRWANVYAGTATINTSDEREKQQIGPIDPAALRAWAKVEFCQFKFNNSVESKGDRARWHFGVMAQRVKAAFESEGLDPFAYGLLCYDEWAATPEVPEVLDQTTGEVLSAAQPAQPAGNRYGIRYEEALALECAYLRSKLTA